MYCLATLVCLQGGHDHRRPSAEGKMPSRSFGCRPVDKEKLCAEGANTWVASLCRCPCIVETGENTERWLVKVWMHKLIHEGRVQILDISSYIIWWTIICWFHSFEETDDIMLGKCATGLDSTAAISSLHSDSSDCPWLPKILGIGRRWSSSTDYSNDLM